MSDYGGLTSTTLPSLQVEDDKAAAKKKADDEVAAKKKAADEAAKKKVRGGRRSE